MSKAQKEIKHDDNETLTMMKQSRFNFVHNFKQYFKNFKMLKAYKEIKHNDMRL